MDKSGKITRVWAYADEKDENGNEYNTEAGTGAAVGDHIKMNLSGASPVQQPSLPTFAAFKANYPTVKDENNPDNPTGGKDMPAKDVYKLIGGEVQKTAGNAPNACAARWSRAMNYSGVTIPHIPGQTYKGADGKFYFLVASQAYQWMVKTYKPDILLTNKDGPDFYSKVTGNHGILMMIPMNPRDEPGGFGASGRATYFDGIDCNRDSRDGSSEGCYFDAEGGVKFIALWKLK